MLVAMVFTITACWAGPDHTTHTTYARGQHTIGKGGWAEAIDWVMLAGWLTSHGILELGIADVFHGQLLCSSKHNGKIASRTARHGGWRGG